jgi:2-keto-4-pentenoate hydratase/2-oxohepta-3-ene-1,7-dioic acid hydratase in catechol pathway
MRLVTFSAGQGPRAGLVAGDRVVDLSAAGYPTVVSFLEDGAKAIEAANKLAADAGSAPLRSEVKLHAPLMPPKFICIGLNYLDHAKESGMAVPTTPVVFTKYHNAVIGPGEAIVLPPVSSQVDYEAELGFVIGKRGKNIPAERWEEYVFGYTCVHDVSARDYQMATSQWTIGKTFDTFGPIGPELVSKDEAPDPHKMAISFELNGKVMQDSNTDQFIFNIPTLIEYLSKVMTLVPGDLISTGTPPGVGFARKPPVFLKPGDDVVVKIAGVGELRNHCVEVTG